MGIRLSLPLAVALLGLVLGAAPAVAQQPLAVVNPGLVYLPRSGVALDAATGRVRWRTPRYSGQVLSDGRGLLIVSYVAFIRHGPPLSYDWVRYCRLRPADGRAAWCINAMNGLGAKLSASGQWLYVQRPGRVDVYDTGSGQRLRSVATPRGEMLALPDNGVAVFTARPRRSRLWAFSLARKQAIVKRFPRPIFAFHGAGAGVLWYAPQAGAFISPLGAAPPLPAAGGATGGFPNAVANRWGFAVSQAEGRRSRLSGGFYGRPAWSHAVNGDPALRLFGRSVLIWLRSGRNTYVSVFSLARGRRRFRRRVPARIDAALMDRGLAPPAAPDVALFGPRDLLWLDGRGGRVRWWHDIDGDQPAALTAPAVLAWDGGNLVAFGRRYGDILWRVRFRLGGR